MLLQTSVQKGKGKANSWWQDLRNTAAEQPWKYKMSTSDPERSDLTPAFHSCFCNLSEQLSSHILQTAWGGRPTRCGKLELALFSVIKNGNLGKSTLLPTAYLQLMQCLRYLFYGNSCLRSLLELNTKVSLQPLFFVWSQLSQAVVPLNTFFSS